jgi:tripartite ATP-independent transporter DctM subunit
VEVWTLTVIVFGLLVFLLILGVPIAFALCGIATAGIYVLWGPKGLYLMFNTAYGESTNFLLLAIPLFVFMANMLKFSGMGDQLYEVVYRWMGRFPGGLAIGTVIICALFAAMAGISSVATISMGLIALPSMMKRGYDKNLAIGSIAAGGALGILIPPSIIMILYGAVAEVSIGKLFIGGIIPGILLCLIFIVYIFFRTLINKDLAPPVQEKYSFVEKLIVLKGVLLPILLVFLVLGVIYGGVCTPTEASAVGAFGAIVCALVYGKLTWENLKNRPVGHHEAQCHGLLDHYRGTCFFPFPGLCRHSGSHTGNHSVLEGIPLADSDLHADGIFCPGHVSGSGGHYHAHHPHLCAHRHRPGV